MREMNYIIEPIGVVRSELTNREDAPRQGDEGAPEAWLELRTEFAPALAGVDAGDELIVLTWLHQAQREVLQVHPRGDLNNPLAGVFATRSPDRPNPIGLHRVSVLAVDGARLRVPLTADEAALSRAFRKVIAAGGGDEPEGVDKAMDEYGPHITAALERHMPILATIANVAPMVGSIGTVVGMVILFQGLFEMEKTAEIMKVAAGGIKVKLYATAFGLLVGVPAYVFYSYFNTAINRFVLEAEETATALIEALTVRLAAGTPPAMRPASRPEPTP